MFKSLNNGARRALATGVCLLVGVGSLVHAQSSTNTTLSLQAQVGQQLFFDTNLSASKQMSCATCHDPNSHYAPSNALSVQLGGPNLITSGFEARKVFPIVDRIIRGEGALMMSTTVQLQDGKWVPVLPGQ